MAEEFQASLLGAKIVTSPKLLISSKTWPPISIITSRNLRKAPFSFSYIKEIKTICFKIFYSLYKKTKFVSIKFSCKVYGNIYLLIYNGYIYSFIYKFAIYITNSS